MNPEPPTDIADVPDRPQVPARPPLPGEPWLLAFALATPIVFEFINFVVIPHDTTGQPQTNPLFAVMYGVGKAVQYGVPFAWLYYTARHRLHPGRQSTAGIGTGVGFALLVAALMLALYFGWLKHTSAFDKLREQVTGKIAGFGLDSLPLFLTAGLAFSAVHSFLEEWYFRWLVYGGLRQYLTRWPALIVSSLFFMGHHVILLAVYFPGKFWTHAVPLSLGIAVGGAFWAWLYDRSRSLIGPWISHALLDATLMAIGCDIAFGKT